MQIRIMRTHVYNIRNILSFYSLRGNNAYLRLNVIMVFNILHGQNQCACVGVWTTAMRSWSFSSNLYCI